MKLPQNSDHTEATDPKLSAKKPYEKPAFRFEQVFETRALNCGKTATQGQCFTSRRNS